MKLKATILFCCLFVYIIELAALPVYCGPSQKEKSSCSGKVGKVKNTCARKMAGSCNRKMGNSPCKESSNSKKNNTADCCITNCPLCYVMTFNDVIRAGKSSDLIKREYPRYQSNYLFNYCPTAWKPPNGC